MLFYSIELLHIHITCLHVYYCLHIPSSLAQDARLCHGRGKDSRKLWRYPNSSSRLGFHGFGVAHAKGGLEVALPPNASIPLSTPHSSHTRATQTEQLSSEELHPRVSLDFLSCNGPTLSNTRCMCEWHGETLKLQKAQFCKAKNLENNEQRKTRFYKVRLTDRQKLLRGEGAQYSHRVTVRFARINSLLCV